MHLISQYTRAQALKDGSLIDVTETAKEAGFVWPVALTSAAWADSVAWSAQASKRKNIHQDEAGRLWDVLWMARFAIKTHRGNGTVLTYPFHRVPRPGRGHLPRLNHLTIHTGPGDDGAPVMTISLPDED